jgi:hypothetical protein
MNLLVENICQHSITTQNKNLKVFIMNARVPQKLKKDEAVQKVGFLDTLPSAELENRAKTMVLE